MCSEHIFPGTGGGLGSRAGPLLHLLAPAGSAGRQQGQRRTALTLHIAHAVLADHPSVVLLVRGPLVDEHGRVGGPGVQHDAVLQAERRGSAGRPARPRRALRAPSRPGAPRAAEQALLGAGGHGEALPWPSAAPPGGRTPGSCPGPRRSKEGQPATSSLPALVRLGHSPAINNPSPPAKRGYTAPGGATRPSQPQPPDPSEGMGSLGFRHRPGLCCC